MPKKHNKKATKNRAPHGRPENLQIKGLQKQPQKHFKNNIKIQPLTGAQKTYKKKECNSQPPNTLQKTT